MFKNIGKRIEKWRKRKSLEREIISLQDHVEQLIDAIQAHSLVKDKQALRKELTKDRKELKRIRRQLLEPSISDLMPPANFS